MHFKEGYESENACRDWPWGFRKCTGKRALGGVDNPMLSVVYTQGYIEVHRNQAAPKRRLKDPCREAELGLPFGERSVP